ncbi:MAG TPA: hypothetical protein VFQ68_26125 [Streptosporangiaceae bacterium]|nr:hypothetical protein [Streptosporangiaceae bacterium]
MITETTDNARGAAYLDDPGMSVLTVNVAHERAFCAAMLLPGSLRRGAKRARDPVECLGSAKCRPLGECG